VTYAEAERQMAELDRRMSLKSCAVSVRSRFAVQGTIGGNIANGSPIGDMPPMLIALGARIVLRKGENSVTFAGRLFH
jgi:xanthine dehydrogenase iron-sulfur cluster and FAD-binding subunit A